VAILDLSNPQLGGPGDALPPPAAHPWRAEPSRGARRPSEATDLWELLDLLDLTLTTMMEEHVWIPQY
jgi:hypothetical protein